MFHAALILSPDALDSAYGNEQVQHLKLRVDTLALITPSSNWRRHLPELASVDVIFSGWGAPLMNAEFLAHTPRLRAVFYAGGSVRYFVTEEFWQRGIRLTTAQAINAKPVSEFAVSALILGLKRVWHFAHVTRATRTFPTDRPLAGAYRSRVGLASYGTIARMVRERLRAFDVEVLVYDPFLTEAEACREDVRLVGLDELFALSDAVSVHTPHLPQTVGLIKGHHLASMRPGAFFLNTARGEVVDELAMVEVLARRPDLTALLDVTTPEPPLPESPLYRLPNVILTPHIAGSVGSECLRMGQAMLEEFERFTAGQALRHEINAQRAQVIA